MITDKLQAILQLQYLLSGVNVFSSCRNCGKMSSFFLSSRARAADSFRVAISTTKNLFFKYLFFQSIHLNADIGG